MNNSRFIIVASCLNGTYRKGGKGSRQPKPGCFSRRAMAGRPTFCPDCGQALFYERVTSVFVNSPINKDFSAYYGDTTALAGTNER